VHLPFAPHELQHWPVELGLHSAPVGRRQMPGFAVPAAQHCEFMLVGLHVDPPATQTPFWHVSAVQARLSALQLVPFDLFCTPQTPLVHVACWHWLGVGQSLAVVQVTQPAIGVFAHVWLVWLQVSVVHGLPSSHWAFVVQQPAISVC
jgi:hypothetical protein